MQFGICPLFGIQNTMDGSLEFCWHSISWKLLYFPLNSNLLSPHPENDEYLAVSSIFFQFFLVCWHSWGIESRLVAYWISHKWDHIVFTLQRCFTVPKIHHHQPWLQYPLPLYYYTVFLYTTVSKTFHFMVGRHPMYLPCSFSTSNIIYEHLACIPWCMVRHSLHFMPSGRISELWSLYVFNCADYCWCISSLLLCDFSTFIHMFPF